jgi:hypothetical protein
VNTAHRLTSGAGSRAAGGKSDALMVGAAQETAAAARGMPTQGHDLTHG